MKRLYYISAAILIVMTSAILQPSCKSAQTIKFYFEPVQVSKILSYNRLEVKLRKKKEYVKIKLIGVSVPPTWKLKKLFYKYNIPRDQQRKYYTQRKKAASFLEKSVKPGDVLYVEYGFKKTDKYGNNLVYMYMPDHSMLNEEFIRQGYSFPYLHADNNKYRLRFYTALKDAIKKKNGLYSLWEKEDPGQLKGYELPSVAQAESSQYRIKGLESISIMTFNVENLFDTSHDPGKSDYGYLPLSKKKSKEHQAICKQMSRGYSSCMKMDWSERAVSSKMKNLAGAVLTYNNGRGPDILILQEVENFGILERFRKEFLRNAGYLTSVLIEGDDFRGIDIGIVSRLPLAAKPKLHTIPFKKDRSTRGILEVSLELPDGSRLYIFGLHFPSQASPVDSRIQSLQFLNKLQSGLPSRSIVIAAGDCNVTSKEENDLNVLRKYLSSNWLISHMITKMNMKGSTYYKRTDKWSFFDIILFSKNLQADTKSPSPWMVIPESIRISTSFRQQLTADGKPRRFELKGYYGVSDHLPVVAKIKLRK